MNQLLLEKKANDFRNIHGLGSNDNFRVRSLLYKLNVQTVFKPLSSGFSGLSIKVKGGDGSGNFMLINSNKSLGHQHFSICHELYHLFIQDDFTSKVCFAGEFNRKDSEEFNADVFASYLLLPETRVKSVIPDEELGKNKITLKTILKIEQYFSCSRAALLYRLKSLDIISRENYDSFSQHVKRGAVEFGYPTDLYEKGNHNKVIGDYGTVARDLFDKEIISESHYISLLLDLGMNVGEIEKFGNGE